MPPSFTGGCYCGNIRYECSAAANQIQMFKCHCRDCQRVSGGAYSPVVYVPAKTLRITRGKIRHHVTDGEANHEHVRGFCPECGSRVTGGEGPGSTGIGVTASSLDDPGLFQPKCEMWTADTQPWDRLDPDLPAFEKYPPGP